MSDGTWSGGLADKYEYMLANRPEDPNMRESASIWAFEENGEFALPRIGIEAIGSTWDKHRLDLNYASADGRVLYEVRMDADSRSPLDEDGQPTILGTGGLAFRCIEPYRRWRVTYEGRPVDTTTEDMIADKIDPERRADLRFAIDITMEAPAWAQDNTPEALAKMNERERTDAGLMGYGSRMEQQWRGSGTLWIDGKERSFNCNGNRIKRQSVRPLDAFRGHCWQAAIFPDGRAFGYCAYPPAADGSAYNEGYVYQDGKYYPAIATKIPWLSSLTPSGEDTSVELTSELGVTRVQGVSGMNLFKIGREGELAGFALNQGGTKYTWDGQTAYGMIERSTWLNKLG